ncbi:hypothetical protein SUNI508_11979 [Seiridium unicorne]|uniref:Uncharacterized protein n=1 Tax=Seiridium unicorne TaxID=138068 RepID=A0ABR2UFD6_9PEZI
MSAHQLTIRKTILVTGGSAGIGFAVARSFAQASASKIILTGRRADVLASAVTALSKEFCNVSFRGYTCDVGKLEDTADLWNLLRTNGIYVDVLILNAARLGGTGDILTTGLQATWEAYERNVRSSLDFIKRFYTQDIDADKQQVRPIPRPKVHNCNPGAPLIYFTNKYVVFVSSKAIHDINAAAMAPSYTLSKIFGQVLMQAIAAGVDRKRMQIVSFHPGVILSETVRNGGYTEDSPVDWDSVDLPGQFAVWAATEQAAFLHGRFAWAAWDVDELRVQMLRTEDEDNLFLTIGVRGI